MQEITLNQARTIGRKKAITAIVVLILVEFAILFFRVPRGDAGNLLVVFIYNLTKLSTLVVYIGLFLLAFFFGGMSGKEIICQGRHFVVTGIKYGILMYLGAWCLGVLSSFLKLSVLFEGSFSHTVRNILWPLVRAAVNWTILLYLAAWLFATYRIHVAALRLRSGQAKRATSL